MSNFPPPPPFGGGYFHSQPPFTPQPPIPPPNSFPVNQQFQYMQQRPQPFPPGPPPHQSNQFNNPPNFIQNQYHMPAPPFQPPQPVPQNLYPFPYHGNHLPQPNGPGLPFTQTPPHLGNFNPMHGSIQVPASGPSQASTPQLQHPTPNQEQVLRQPHAVPRTTNPFGQPRPQGELNDHSLPSAVEDGAISHRSFNMEPAKQNLAMQAAQINNFSTQNSTTLESTQNHGVRKVAENSYAENVKDIALAAANRAGSTFNLPGLDHHDPEPHSVDNIAQKRATTEHGKSDATAWHKKKAEAKAALLELLTGGVTYEQIAKEGVELDILRALAPSSFVSRPLRSTAPTNATEPAPASRQDSVSLEPGEVSDSSSSDRNALETTIDASSQKQINHAVPASPTTATGPPDREDYIARLQAAKQAVVKSNPTTAELKTDNTPASSHSEPTRIERTGTQPTEAGPPRETKKPEAKDPVQTELVRKRLEALKSAQSRQIGSGHQGSTSQLALAAQSSQERQLALQTVRSKSFYADSDQQLLEGLPGLSPVTMAKSALTDPDHSSAYTLSIPSLVDPESSAAIAFGPGHHGSSNTDQSSAAAVTASRKRPSASDFIDSPPTRKRHLGDDKSVQHVIELSDDEDGEIHSESESSKLPSPESSMTPGKHLNIELSGLRNKPPLTNFPFGSAISRPASQVQTPKTLSQVEAELAAEKERLAVAMRSKKISRTDSSQDVSLGKSNSGNATPNRLIESENQLEKSQQMKQQQQRSLAASRERIREKLEAERRTHALITARAEQEQRQAASATTLTERERRLQRKAILESSLPKLDAGIEVARNRMEEISRQQLQLQADIDRDIKDRQAVLDEISALMNIDISSEGTSTKHGATSEAANRNVDQRAEEPVTEVERTEDANATTEIAENSTNMHNAEAVVLSSHESSADSPDVRPLSQAVSSHADDALEDDMDISGSSDEEDEEEASKEETQELEDSLYGDDVDPKEGPTESGVTTDNNMHDEELVMQPDSYDPSLVDRFSDDDEDEDIESIGQDAEMDVYPESSHEAESGEYEPTPVSETAFPGVSRSPERDHTVFGSSAGEDVGHKGRVVEISSASAVMEAQSEDGEIPDESGDYEPPEPAQAVDNTTGEGPVSEAKSVDDASLTTHEGRNDELHINGNSSGNEGKLEHYTPYESPLNRFHSYRYHPQYVKNVPGGFSSLTFSHKIQTNRTLCRWELAGGICNDSACEFQHFRDLPCSGNKILLELGSVQEGNTAEEQQQYVDGLRELLASMRDRGQGDIEAIAAAIVAYRSRFLKDPTRVITRI